MPFLTFSVTEALAGAIVALAHDPSVRQRQGQAGRLRVETHFTDVATADKVDDVIRDVLGKRGTRDTKRTSGGNARPALGQRHSRKRAERGNA